MCVGARVEEEGINLWDPPDILPLFSHFLPHLYNHLTDQPILCLVLKTSYTSYKRAHKNLILYQTESVSEPLCFPLTGYIVRMSHH
jgi:hypothetical protein